MKDERIQAVLSNGTKVGGWLLASEEYTTMMRSMSSESIIEGYEPIYSELMVLLDNGMGFCEKGAYTQSAISLKLVSIEPAMGQDFSDGRLRDPEPDMEFFAIARERLLG